jgi:hypothetical protein
MSNHEVTSFQPCTFGDGGFYYHDNADRIVCSCGWRSAPVVRDRKALVALFEVHARLAMETLPVVAIKSLPAGNQ